MAVPIWKDYFVDLGGGSSSDFRIKVGDQVIYSGKSYKRPGASSNRIRINDVCADYLQTAVPDMASDFTGLGSPVVFLVQRYTANQWTDVESVSFLNDWSYDYDYNPETMGLSFPVNSRIDARQWVVFSALESSMITATVHLKNGASFNIFIPVEISADFNADFNADFAKALLRPAQSGTAVFDLTRWPEAQSITIGGTTYEIVTDCGEWAFYYVNAHGGWDTFLIEGGSAMRDELTRRLRKVEYDNRDASARGTRNYANELSRVFTFHTSWLSDAESARMHHLLNSTEVFLLEIGTGRFIPVTVNGNTTNYKTYRSNGCRLVNYDIEVTLAQDMTRR